jgi:hydrophobe/amphiphile efflux-1 (HAE1) family protein
MSLSQACARRPVGSALVAIGIVLTGILAYSGLSVATVPAIDVPTIIISARLPGAGPETMATSVATPLERRLGKIASVTEITSINTLGATQINVQFEYGRSIEGAATDVQAAINAAAQELPREMPTPPVFKKINPIIAPMAFLAVTSDTLPLGQVYDYVETVVAQKLTQLDGVGNVLIQGSSKSAVRVRVNPVALASVGLGLEDVRAAITSGSVDLPQGSFDGVRQMSIIASNNQLTDADGYRPLIIKNAGGKPVRLGDIAAVAEGLVDTRVAGFYNERPAVFAFVQRRAGSSTVATVDRIREALPQIRSWLPAAIRIELVTDRTITIRGTLREAQLTFLVTTIMVVCTIFFFIRNVTATLIASLSIPIALAGTLGVMYLLNYSLDIISLTALTVAVGFVVDDSIVMVENIARFREDGHPPLQAALLGARQITFTVIAITFSLVAAFIPLLLSPGVTGVLLKEFSVTLCSAILFSALISLTLTAALSGRFLRGRSRPQTGLSRAAESFLARFLALYQKTLTWSLRHPKLMLGLVILITIGNVALFVVVPKGFLPIQDTGIISGLTEAAPDTSFAAMQRRQLEIAKIILGDPAVANVNSSVGASAIETGGGAASMNIARFYVTLKPRSERDPVMVVISRLRTRLAQVASTLVYLQPVQDLNVGARDGKGQYQYTLKDAGWDELARSFPIVLAAMRRLPELRDVGIDLENGGLQAKLEIDRDRAAVLGVSPRAVDETLYSAFGQRRVAIINGQRDQRYVVLEVDTGRQTDAGLLDQVYVKSTTGEQIPLRSIARFTEDVAALTIPHQDGFPSVTVTFNLADGVALGTAVSTIERKVEELGLPTLRASFQGKAGAFRASSGSEPYLLLAALFAVYIALGVLYESYIHPLTIISSLPSAGVGALLALLITGTDLSLIAFIGMILLVGIVKKNAILIVDFALHAERHEAASPSEAIYRACLLRFRPIVMTNMAAMLGAVPIALGGSAGAELRQPLGITIVGGLALSSILTLYSTPVIYLLLDRLRQRPARLGGVRLRERLSPAE